MILKKKGALRLLFSLEFSTQYPGARKKPGTQNLELNIKHQTSNLEFQPPTQTALFLAIPVT